MKKNILVLGSGHVAVSIGAILAQEGNNVTMIDENADKLSAHHDRFDIRTVAGHPSHPDVLEQADAGNADLLIAMLPSEDGNLVAAQIAHTLFNIPTKIVRLEAATYTQNEALFSDKAFPVDGIISPQQLVAENIRLLLDYPGAVQVFEFASGRCLLVAAIVAPDAERPGEPPPVDGDENFRVAAAYRGDQALDLRKETLRAGDEVYCVVARAHAKRLVHELTGRNKPHKKVFIGGGGNCGMHLARLLEGDYRVKLIERDPGRADFLSRTLADDTIVLRATANDEAVLRQEGIETSDVFCALTNDDEDNIMSALLARSFGVKCVMSLVSRPSYVKLVEKMVDIAISPQEYSIGPLLCRVRDSDITSVCSLRHGESEMIEVVAHGEASSSRVVGRKIKDVRWPQTMTVAAIARNDEVLMPQPDTVIEDRDHILLFIAGRHRIGEVEKLFRISATFV